MMAWYHCWFTHKWTKWGDKRTGVRTVTNAEGEVSAEPWYVQSRRCELCNYIEVRGVSS